MLGARFLPAPLLVDIHFDWRVLAFTLATSLLTCIFFGIGPAWQAARVDLHDAIKRAGTSGLSGSGPSRLRDSLVIAQIALSLALAITASLFFRTILALHGAALGYRTEGILVAYADAPARKLPEALGRPLLRRSVCAIAPDTRSISAAGAMGLPAGQYSSNGSFAIEGKQSFGGDFRKLPYAGFRLASPK